MDWRQEIEQALMDFHKVAHLGGIPISEDVLSVEILPAPHSSPARLPKNRMAVYAFWGDGNWLKVGKAGPNSAPRYTSQHYNPKSAQSTLAGSMLKCPIMGARYRFPNNNPGDWLRANAHRVNIMMPKDLPTEFQSLLEAFLHLRLRPRYEGR